MAYTRLPKSLPKSLQFEKKAPSPLVKARTHQKKAEALHDEAKKAERDGRAPKGPKDPTSPHLQYLERWKAIEAAVEGTREKAKKEYRGRFDRDDLGPHELLGHLIGTLPVPRMKMIFDDERIGKLNALLLRPGRKINSVIMDNEMLEDIGITWPNWMQRRRDLKFKLGNDSYKSAMALAMYLTVVRAGADPKVRKKANFVQDKEVLDLANGILRDVATHIVEDMQTRKDEFLKVGKRMERAIQARGRKV